jgi:hypothetical protein
LEDTNMTTTKGPAPTTSGSAREPSPTHETISAALADWYETGRRLFADGRLPSRTEAADAAVVVCVREALRRWPSLTKAAERCPVASPSRPLAFRWREEHGVHWLLQLPCGRWLDGEAADDIEANLAVSTLCRASGAPTVTIHPKHPNDVAAEVFNA